MKAMTPPGSAAAVPQERRGGGSWLRRGFEGLIPTCPRQDATLPGLSRLTLLPYNALTLHGLPPTLGQQLVLSRTHTSVTVPQPSFSSKGILTDSELNRPLTSNSGTQVLRCATTPPRSSHDVKIKPSLCAFHGGCKG